MLEIPDIVSLRFYFLFLFAKEFQVLGNGSYRNPGEGIVAKKAS